MILFRYLAREVLLTLIAVTTVLLLIIMSGRFVKYLADAAAGELAAPVLFALVGYRIPSFLELILPLGLFLGILLSYGRLYLDNEMAVMSACGIGQGRLQWLTMGPALLVAMLVALMSLWLSPAGMVNVETIFQEQEQSTDFDALTTGQFQIQGRQRATYIESMENQRLVARSIFLADGSNDSAQVGIVLAERASQFVDPRTGSRFILLKQGVRYEGEPGRADYREIRFDEYAIKIRESRVREEVSAADAQTTRTLLASDRADYRAQLHWRFSLPVLCLVVALLAVPLSRVNPRQGRYARLLPSILIYLFYVTLLTSARGRVEHEQAGPYLIWLVHAGMLLLAANFHWLSGFWNRLFSVVGSALGGLVWSRERRS